MSNDLLLLRIVDVMLVLGAPLVGGTGDLAFVMLPNDLRTIGTLARCGIPNSRLLVAIWLVISNSFSFTFRFRCMVMANELAMNYRIIILGKEASR